MKCLSLIHGADLTICSNFTASAQQNAKLELAVHYVRHLISMVTTMQLSEPYKE